MQLKYLAIAGITICGTAMHSIASVDSEAVTARTKAMSEISDKMRVLGLMLKGQVEFDLVSAKTAIQNIQKLAAKTPILFELEAVDPHAEARPEIWSNYEDFVKFVVPELQRRGIYHKDYAGPTLRENLGLDYPTAAHWSIPMPSGGH